MGIELKCFATLTEFLPPDPKNHPVEDGETARSLIEKLGIPEEEVTLIFINSVRSELDDPISDGDRVGLFPPVGGG